MLGDSFKIAVRNNNDRVLASANNLNIKAYIVIGH